MIIECPDCNARVNAKEVGTRTDPTNPDDPYAVRIVLCECPSCAGTLIGRQHEIETEYGSAWSEADRLWPKPKREVDWNVPDVVKISLEEAETCFLAGAYSASAVMCGRALEGICVHFKTKNKTLAGGLKELMTNDIIDARLFSWGDELRKVRNLGAHASTERVPKDDAKDVLDFLYAIVNYIFVLNEQFQTFMSRRKRTESPLTPVPKV